MFYDYFVDDFTRKFKVTVWSRLCLKIRVYIAQCRFKGIHQWSNFLSQLITAFSDIIREHRKPNYWGMLRKIGKLPNCWRISYYKKVGTARSPNVDILLHCISLYDKSLYIETIGDNYILFYVHFISIITFCWSNSNQESRYIFCFVFKLKI